jgi:Flp pilus assembly protein CpaB
MNRKLLPLLGIAFVVAVIVTGVFYGLVVGRLKDASRGGAAQPLIVAARSLEPGAVLTKADLKVATWSGPQVPKDAVSSPEQIEGWTVLQAIGENEPLLRTRLASAQAAGGAALAIPSGMRAVSIQTPDSAGVLRLLRPGHKVDVQVIRSKGGPRSAEAEIRTMLQDVEVLATPEKEGRQASAPVLTVLAKPAEAELLSLADASARLRVVLRNPLDRESSQLRGGDLVTLFHNRPAAPARVVRVQAPPRPLPPSEPRVRFDVRVAGAAPAAVEMLQSALATQRPVAAFRPGWDLEQALSELQAQRQLEVLSSSLLVTGNQMPVGMEAACGIRVHLVPWIGAGGRLRLRVAGGPRAAEADLEAADGQGLLVSGLANDDCSKERLYAGREAPDGAREVVVLVTPRLRRAAAPPRPTAALLSKP